VVGLHAVSGSNGQLLALWHLLYGGVCTPSRASCATPLTWWYISQATTACPAAVGWDFVAPFHSAAAKPHDPCQSSAAFCSGKRRPGRCSVEFPAMSCRFHPSGAAYWLRYSWPLRIGWQMQVRLPPGSGLTPSWPSAFCVAVPLISAVASHHLARPVARVARRRAAALHCIIRIFLGKVTFS
jgi:hypothetical protein